MYIQSIMYCLFIFAGFYTEVPRCELKKLQVRQMYFTIGITHSESNLDSKYSWPSPNLMYISENATDNKYF